MPRRVTSRCICPAGTFGKSSVKSCVSYGNHPDERGAFSFETRRGTFLCEVRCSTTWFRGCTKRRRAPTPRPLKQRNNASRLLVHRRLHSKWLPRPPRSPPSSSTAPSPVRTAPSPVHRVSRVFRVSRTHRDPTDPETRPEARPRASSASVSVHTASVNTSVSCLPSSRSRTSRRARPGRRFRVGDRFVRFSQQPSRGFLHLLSVD